MDDKEIQRNFDIVAAYLASMAVNQEKADERIARLERTLLLAIRAGRRERREWRERHEALIDALMRTEARMDAGFAKLSKSQANTDAALVRLTESQERTDVTFAKTDAALATLAESQTHSDRKLEALIDIVRKDRQEPEDRHREG